jgi:8-hydroxy-5-deazaflavin:NADPH oxidoreductase
MIREAFLILAKLQSGMLITWTPYYKMSAERLIYVKSFLASHQRRTKIAAVILYYHTKQTKQIMGTIKTIAIVGATGNMGSSIAKSLAANGKYRLLLMANNQEKLSELKSQLETTGTQAEVLTISCAREASWEADIIIVATPYEAEKEVAERIREVATGKIVISISNPLNDKYNELVTSPDTSAAEELQKLLPNSKVVKTFNTTFAADFITPVIDGKTADAFVAGNNGDAVDTVSQVVKSAGFNPVVVGDLTVSRTLERMQLMLIQLNIKNNYNWLAGWKILHH